MRALPALLLLAATIRAADDEVDALRRALATGDAAARLAAAGALARLGPRAHAATGALIDLGRTGAWREHFAARDALAAIGGAAAAPLLRATAGSDDVRLLAAGVFHDLGAKTVPAALEALASDDERLRAAAADALGDCGPGGELAGPALGKALHDLSASVRRRSARALGAIGADAADALPGLIHLANDPERGTVPEAIAALGAILRDAAEREPRPRSASDEVYAAIARRASWLAGRQREDGSWGNDAAVTALACLALLESNAPGRHGRALRRGLRHLVARQAAGGGFGPRGAPRSRQRDAATAAALAVAARLTDDPLYRDAAARAMAFLVAARGGDDDATAAGWRVLALQEGAFAGVPVAAEQRGEAATAAGLLGRVAAGGRLDDARVRAAVQRRMDRPPRWDAESGVPDLDGWLLDTRALWYLGGEPWRKWSQELTRALLSSRPDGEADGRVRATALICLCLETAAGHSHPWELRLPSDARFRAAIATLKIARARRDPVLRAAAERALAGFSLR